MTRSLPRPALLLLPAAALAAALSLTGCSIGVTGADDAARTSSDRQTSGASDTKPPAPKKSAATSTGLGAIANGPCDGRSFDIDQDGAILVLDGACGDVTISASNVQVNLDSAASLTITGSANHVIANKDLGDVRLGGDANTLNGDDMGAVTLVGQNATLLAKDVASLTATGSYNTANWDTGAQSAQDSGTGNLFVGPM